ncbi:MAG: outer membrane protein assembly factor BamA [Verrucomicrobiota bacterium]|nr:outer membrane protein assembly factor BamA [Verrucomicrobiota bacterium]
MTRTGAIVVALAVLAFATAAARAASDTAPVVERLEIRNLGAGRLDESFVRMHIDTRAGSRFDRAVVSRDVKALLATGRFTRVDVSLEPLANGVALVYAFVNKLTLTAQPKVTGADHFSESEIRDLLGLKEGDRVDDAVLGVAARKAVKEYRDDHYPEATVSWDIRETDRAEGLCRLAVMVDEGRKAHVKNTLFTGSREVEARDLRRAAGQRSRWNPADWLARWDWFPWWKRGYRPEEFDAARLAIRDLYLNRGFLDAVVGDPQTETDADGRIIVHYDIQEGRRYRLGTATISGVKLFPESEFLGARGVIRLAPGEPASFSAIRNAGEAAREYYTARGYLDTMVKYALKPDRSSGRVDVNYEVKEGALTRIGNIGIRGNTRTKDKVIRREVLVCPGEIYNETKLRASERRLMNLGYFQSVRAYPAGGEAPDIRDMVFDVEEKRTGQFSMGAGFSSVEKLTGYLEVSQGNFDIAGRPFTGGGQKAKLGIQYGQTRRRYDLSFVEPWFLDHRLLLGVDLYLSEVDYDNYDIDRTGGAVRLGRGLPGNNRVELTCRLENVRTRNIADTNDYTVLKTGDPYSFLLNENVMENSIRLALSHDTRNSPFFPSSGAHAMIFGSLMGGPLGFDTELYGVGLQAGQFVPLWFGHVLSVFARGEVVDSYGDTEETPISNRLFLGGLRTVRGFKYRAVGPKAARFDAARNEEVHRPIGGRTLAIATVEYSLPAHPELKVIRLAAFHDIGNAWLDPYDFDFSEYAQSAGIGLRFNLPQFPIRFDYAWPLHKDDPRTDTERFSFSISYGNF